VDADLRGGNVAAYLDLDPRRGLLAVGYGDSSALGARVDEELQDAGGFSVLAGIERSESRSRVSSELLVGAITMLAGRYDEVVVDVGETLAGTTPAAVEAVMRAANTVLLVVRSDLVSLWNTRACLQHLREGIGVEHGALQIVINRQGGHSGYDAAAVQSALAAPVLAALPEDRRAIAAAVERQSPVTANGGRLARELRSLAKRLSAEATDAAPAHQSAFGRWRRAPVENV
jgi:Flp pilus assembly CpaE family ATPase